MTDASRGDLIIFELPKVRGFRAGKVVSTTKYNGIQMPIVTDRSDNEYPVHPNNIQRLSKYNE